MKRTLLSTVAAVAVTMLLATSASAQFQVGPYAGLCFDGTEILVGGQARIPVGAEIAGMPIMAKPGIEFYPFLDSDLGTGVDYSLFVVNLDAVVPIDLSESLDAYAGAGLYVARSSISIDTAYEGYDFDDSDTSIGLNIVGGATFGDDSKSLVPFAEAVLAIGDGGDGFSVRGGVLFSLGGK